MNHTSRLGWSVEQSLLCTRWFLWSSVKLGKNELYQSVRMVQGTVTSVYKRVPLEFCKSR